MSRKPLPLSARVFRNVRKDESGCWLWALVLQPSGYATMALPGGKTRMAHRVAYELLVGPIPEGLTLDHLCRVRHCVNPAHLEPVTQRENILRGEGVAAVNATLSHCRRGHEFTSENTYTDHAGGRTCRTCRRARIAAYRQRIRPACESCGDPRDPRAKTSLCEPCYRASQVVTHGTSHAYNRHGCRCDLCRARMSAYRKRVRVPA